VSKQKRKISGNRHLRGDPLRLCSHCQLTGCRTTNLVLCISSCYPLRDARDTKLGTTTKTSRRMWWQMECLQCWKNEAGTQHKRTKAIRHDLLRRGAGELKRVGGEATHVRTENPSEVVTSSRPLWVRRSIVSAVLVIPEQRHPGTWVWAHNGVGGWRTLEEGRKTASTLG
jgi:hypothetical protein